MAVSFKMSAADIRARLAERIYSDAAYSRLPQHRRAYLSGYHDAISRAHYASLEWRMWWRGSLVLSADILPNTWCEIDSNLSRHVYIGRPDRPY